MGIKYELAPDIQQRVNDIAITLFPHVRLDSVVCIRSFGSSSRGTIARCHALGKAMQIALGRKGFYVIEVISKRFDKFPEIEQTKTLIHELMHIPKSFGGGFIHHDVVHDRNVEIEYRRYINLKRVQLNNFQEKSYESNLIEESEQIEENNFQEEEDNPYKIVIYKKKKRFWF